MMAKIKMAVVKLIVSGVMRMPHFILAQVVDRMAISGEGTDSCLQIGCLPMRVFSYWSTHEGPGLAPHSVPNTDKLLQGGWQSDSPQSAFLTELGKVYGRECNWAQNPSGVQGEVYTEDGTYSFGSAASAHCVVRHFRPRRVVQIGSGSSSLVIARALSLNASEGGEEAEFTIVDSSPDARIQNLPGVRRVMKHGVEFVDGRLFDSLSKGDIVYAECGHCFSHSDYIVLRILPRLLPGVVIHLDEVKLPHEYPKLFATNPKFRVFWTEAHVVRMLLEFSKDVEVLLNMHYLEEECQDVVRATFPYYDSVRCLSKSGSLWIQKRQSARDVKKREYGTI